jgi:hypothetical protein
MSHYVYGEVKANCDVQTMTRVLENMVPSWKGKIESSDLGDIALKSNYQQDKGKYHIRVAHSNNTGIIYEDFGMRRENGKWMVAMGGHSSVAGKAQKKFEDELPGEIGKLKAQNLIKKMGVFGLEEEETDDEFVFKFSVDGDDLLADTY